MKCLSSAAVITLILLLATDGGCAALAELTVNGVADLNQGDKDHTYLIRAWIEVARATIKT